MAKTERLRIVNPVLLFCALLAIGSVDLVGAPRAAGQAPGEVGATVEEVAAPLTETVAPPVREATETASSPTGEVVETVTRPVREATGVATPPMHEVTEAVAPPVEEATETVVQPVRELTERASGSSPGDTGNSPAEVTGEAAGTATPTAQKTVGAVREATSSTSSAPPGPGIKETLNSSGGTMVDTATVAGAARPRSGPAAADLGPGDDTFEAPSSDGAVRAPPPKWLAYVWPAIALTRSAGFTGFLERWETASLRLALATSTDPGGGRQVVAGIHAAGGRAKAPASSEPRPSPFSKITSAIGHFPYNVPGAALGYILIVAIMLIALFAAVRWEIARGRREGRD